MTTENSVKDLYTRIAEKTGIERSIVKQIAMGVIYSPGCSDTEKELENKLVKMIMIRVRK